MNQPSNLPTGVTDNDIDRQAGAFDKICEPCAKDDHGNCVVGHTDHQRCDCGCNGVDSIKCKRCGSLTPEPECHRILGKAYCVSCADIVLGSDA